MSEQESNQLKAPGGKPAPESVSTEDPGTQALSEACAAALSSSGSS